MQTVVILICICNRPRYLREPLVALSTEMSSTRRSVASVVVGDNGAHSAKKVVEAFRPNLPMVYVRLPRPGLVSARNCSLRYGLRHKPGYLVSIDDDEVPTRGWLNGLLATVSTSDAGFAVGPVKPRFEDTPPDWAPQFFMRSGEAFSTSNLIIRAAVIPPKENEWLQQRFTSTGGEDGEFLGRLAAYGARHTVAPSALVLENISPDRVAAKYLWRRGFRDGVVAAMMSSGRTASGMLSNSLHGITKIGYGVNHMAWSVVVPGRFYRAIDDISMGCGLILGSAGVTSKFYGI